jgi:hypothetical protein
MTEYEAARALLESCQMPGFDPEGKETYPAREDGVDSLANALAAAQVRAILAVADELRRLNERQDALHPPCGRTNTFALPGNGVVNVNDVRECTLPSSHAGHHRAGNERWAM